MDLIKIIKRQQKSEISEFSVRYYLKWMQDLWIKGVDH